MVGFLENLMKIMDTFLPKYIIHTLINTHTIFKDP